MKFNHKIEKFWQDEDGSPMMEFVIVAPLFFMFFFWVFELGILSIRWAMLDRGLDLTIRSLRVNEYGLASSMSNEAKHDFLRQQICENSAVLKNCEELLYLEMTALPEGVPIPSDRAACVNRTASTNTRPDVNLGLRVDGETKEIVYVRACYWVDPIMPYGMRLLGASSESKDSNGVEVNNIHQKNGGFAITAKSIYVNEPGQE